LLLSRKLPILAIRGRDQITTSLDQRFFADWFNCLAAFAQYHIDVKERTTKVKPAQLCLLAFLVTVTGFGAGSAPIASAQMTTKQFAHAEDDMRLYEQMVKVSNWIAQYCVWNHRFPEEGDQMEDAKRQLNQLVPNIPYQTGELQLAEGLDADPEYATPVDSPEETFQPTPVAATMDRIQIQSSDLSLTDADIQEYLKHPPEEWNAPPGTITAISNQQNVYVLWAANYKGLPLRDPDSGRVRLIIGHFSLLNDTEE